MSTTTAPRWAEPTLVSAVFTVEQAQRVHALRAAREVLELRIASGSAFAASGSNLAGGVSGLLDLADWIMNGWRPATLDAPADVDAAS